MSRWPRMSGAARGVKAAAAAALALVLALVLVLVPGAPPVAADVTGAVPPAAAARDTTRGALYAVATAHLDTQWRWTIQNTINEYIPATLYDNFALLKRFPDYVFSFEGAFRYMLAKEYYPDDYARLRDYVASGRWRVAGSWVDAADTNIPSFESLCRQALYGNGFFRREFGKTSRDVFLPDCFGFSYALPSIAAHGGIRSFSTQKLTWGSAYGVPFQIGRWQGVDGSTLLAALNPGDYVTQVRGDLSRDSTWVARVESLRAATGLNGAYMYYGTGDTGGAPDSLSVYWVQRSTRGSGPLEVQYARSDELIDLVQNAGPAVALPTWRGELLMTRHGTGCYTSQAVMKRWNRQNEELADAAERACVIAASLGSSPYPRESLRDAWVRFLWHQFHDDLTGTSIPEAYEFSWNDEILCQNRFAGMLENAVASTTPFLDTRVKGVPLAVYNPLAFDREDVVEASVAWPAPPEAITLFGPDGKPVPAQIVSRSADSLRIVFVAHVPATGYAVYDIRAREIASRAMNLVPSDLAVSDSTLENGRYRVRVNRAGDVASIYDKAAGRELLDAPIEWQLIRDEPRQWPAWEIQYEDLVSGPRATVGGPATCRVIESGPARIALEITRGSAHATYRTVLSLATGRAGNRLVFDSDVDWRERETLLKAAFHFRAAADSVTYDLGLGAIKRGTNRKELYEVPGQKWADMTADDGRFGAAVLNDCKYGWDHPDRGTLRLTLLHTPGVAESWSWVGDQRTMDLARHRFAFAIQSHAGGWREGGVVAAAAEFNQRLVAWQVPAHPGPLGRSWSFVSLDAGTSGSALVNAVKQAEDSDEVVVRIRETGGRSAERVELRFARPVIGAREVNGSEEPLGPVRVERGTVVTSLSAYQPRAFAVTLAPPDGRKSARPGARPERGATISQPLNLPFDQDGISLAADRADGDFDGASHTIAGELLPETLVASDVRFALGSSAPRAKNVVSGRGQSLTIPMGPWNRFCALVAAAGGPAMADFAVDGRIQRVAVQDWSTPIAQWTNRLVAGSRVEADEEFAPAYILRAPVAWYGSHRHAANENPNAGAATAKAAPVAAVLTGATSKAPTAADSAAVRAAAAGHDEAYRFTYLYLVTLELPDGARTITLPTNDRVKILAASVAATSQDAIRATRPLYDVADAAVVTVASAHRTFIDSTEVHLATAAPGAEIRYTIDGSDPGPGSPLYAGPVVLRETSTLRARALTGDDATGHVTRYAVVQQTPRNPVVTKSYLSGLRCRYFEGDFRKLPDFAASKPLKEVVVDSVIIPGFARPEDYALEFQGYVEVPRDGMYEFGIESDDGSALYVADSLLINNDGLHGAGDLTGEIALKAGMHRLRALMFQRKGDQALAVRIAGPALERQPLSRGMLRR